MSLSGSSSSYTLHLNSLSLPGAIRPARGRRAIIAEADAHALSEQARQAQSSHCGGSAAETVRSYRGLCEVERAFRSLKTVDLKIRPIHHRLEDRVRAHIFTVHARLLR